MNKKNTITSPDHDCQLCPRLAEFRAKNREKFPDKFNAPVTVEDCIDKVLNRFELVLVASQRARKIGAGAALTIERDNDKNPVVALREIAGETVDVAELKEELIRNNQRVIAIDDDGEDVIDMMEGEEEWGAMNDTEGSKDDTVTEEESSSLADLAGGVPEETVEKA